MTALRSQSTVVILIEAQRDAMKKPPSVPGPRVDVGLKKAAGESDFCRLSSAGRPPLSHGSRVCVRLVTPCAGSKQSARS